MAGATREQIEARWNDIARRIAMLETRHHSRTAVALATADIDQVQRWLGQQHFSEWGQAGRLLDVVEVNLAALEERSARQRRADA